ncbi:translocase of inner membrane 8 [Dermatophagoides farinae]|uniref:Mitochondrial import inner membrane translocase subunit n=1 Tax=Dermatophagoides farinae TaxID=6954 RepID=A0A922L559_DERFA|nr:mitochondrial import inner membrane translocase subunit Tim8 B-like [Dermatophagoides farinae]KAH7641763.1 mitochondrial import inner membrane translocase subunit tim8-like [Dermatophagoides farinae]KAH9518246.1 Mitochondrial import inner membrane translocase subunit Tim8 B [Dermatophagoides farinae]
MAFDLSSSNESGGVDRELKEFLLMEQKKAQFQQQVNRLNDICWDKCVTDKPGSKLDSRTENCLKNCVNRFIDASMTVAQRFSGLIQKQQ